MKDAIDFLDRIEGHGYGGMADYEIARTTVHDGAAEIERLRATLSAVYEWYDRDGSVGGASIVFEQHRVANEQSEKPEKPPHFREMRGIFKDDADGQSGTKE